MARREVDARGRQQVDERIGRGWHGGVNGVEHGLVLVRAGDGEDGRVRAGDVVGLRAETAGDDDAAVLGERLADRFEALGLGAVEEAAGVHDDRLGSGIVGRDRVALGAQAGEDALAVHQRLGAAERDHADARLAGPGRLGDRRAGRAVGAQIGRVEAHRAAIAARRDVAKRARVPGDGHSSGLTGGRGAVKTDGGKIGGGGDGSTEFHAGDRGGVPRRRPGDARPGRGAGRGVFPGRVRRARRSGDAGVPPVSDRSGNEAPRESGGRGVGSQRAAAGHLVGGGGPWLRGDRGLDASLRDLAQTEPHPEGAL